MDNSMSQGLYGMKFLQNLPRKLPPGRCCVSPLLLLYQNGKPGITPGYVAIYLLADHLQAVLEDAHRN